MSGAEFRALDDEGRREAVRTLCVLARSSPHDKHLVVEALKANDEVVAVTGETTGLVRC